MARPTMIGFAFVVASMGAIRDPVVTSAVAEDPRAAFRKTEIIRAITNSGIWLPITREPRISPMPEAVIHLFYPSFFNSIPTLMKRHIRSAASRNSSSALENASCAVIILFTLDIAERTPQL